jgi:DNA-binding NtrC family response regulator
MESRPTVLVVTSDTAQASALIPHLSAADLNVYEVETCREARTFLSSRPTVDVIISDLSLPDGNWCDMVRHMVDHAERAAMIVACSEADERLWSEILWRGVYDLLVEPYDPDQVKRVVEGALRGAHQASRSSPHSAKGQSSSTVAGSHQWSRFQAAAVA